MNLEKSLELTKIIDDVSSFAAFSLGKENILNTEVSFNKLIINRNLSYTKEALEILKNNDTVPFGGIKDIRTTLTKADKGGLLSAQELNDVKNVLAGVNSVIKYYRNIHEVEMDNIGELFLSLVSFNKLMEEIESSIDEYGMVLDSASSELYSIRKQLKKVDADINASIQRFLSKNKDSVVDSIVATRNGRSVILVKSSDKNQYGGLVYGDSSSGQTSYIEPKELLDLNNRKQELIVKEHEEIKRILSYLSSDVAKTAHEQIANIETLGLIDEIFAKANWGRSKDAVCALISEEYSINIEKARHPLIDPKVVVANTYRLIEPKKMLIITGPNTGGKTVSLKIIGLFVLMSYCGIPVPCEAISIPVFDNIFEDIGDDQSVESSLSSFSAHIQKQAKICNEATSESLVLLDELGSGTDPKEGESLGIALLNLLREKKCMTIVTTHYSRLKTYGKRHDDILLASVEFNMNTLEPTYKYFEGITGNSNAISVAKRYGLPKELIKYASFLNEQAKSEEDKLIEELDNELSKVRSELARIEEEKERIENESKELKKAQKNFYREKDEWKYKKEEEAKAYLESIRKEAEEIIDDLKSRKDIKLHEVIDKRKELEKIGNFEEIIDDDNYEFNIGEVIELKSTNQIARIININKKDIVINLNGREMHVKKEQIRPSNKHLPKKDIKVETTVNLDRDIVFSSMSLECNLIGMNVEDAMYKLDNYLDEVKVHNLNYCRIVHGDGTGKLRKAVHNRLQNDNNVKEYHLAPPQEGGTGATIVTFK